MVAGQGGAPRARPLLAGGRMPAVDSVSQFALGAAISVAVMGRRTAVWKAALWGAVAGTLPDLDVLIDHGNAIHNMVLHRAETHAPFWLTLFSLPLAALVVWAHDERTLWRRWWLAIWLALVTHPLLDAMTVYGTQLALPFSDHPYGAASIFIIDPLYTLPLLAGAGWALASRGGGWGLRANLAGLLISTLYLGWGLQAQQQVERVARQALAAQGVQAESVLVTPTAFNTLLWRVVAVSGADYHEGFYSLLDADQRMHFDRFERGPGVGSVPGSALYSLDGVQRIAAFSKGFFKLHQQGAQWLVTDLRMGQEPNYVFSFAVAEQRSPLQALAQPQQIGARIDLARGLRWLWRRALGEPLLLPR